MSHDKGLCHITKTTEFPVAHLRNIRLETAHEKMYGQVTLCERNKTYGSHYLDPAFKTLGDTLTRAKRLQSWNAG